MLLCCYMLVDFARGPSQTPIIQGLEFFNHLIEIEMILPVERCDVLADENGLYEVLQNLIDNALGVSRAGQTIQVCLMVEPTDYRISVTDEGPGVPEHQRRAIFETFVSISRIGEPESTGLGLPYARAVIEAHGGALHCSDGPANRGACFWFTLPRNGERIS